MSRSTRLIPVGCRRIPAACATGSFPRLPDSRGGKRPAPRQVAAPASLTRLYLLQNLLGLLLGLVECIGRGDLPEHRVAQAVFQLLLGFREVLVGDVDGDPTLHLVHEALQYRSVLERLVRVIEKGLQRWQKC